MERPPDRVQSERQRRIDEIFGDVLPGTTTDERDEDAAGPGQSGDHELLANRPPHHDQD